MTCRRRRAGLLVTAHADMGLPMVCETVVTDDIAWRVVEQLTELGADEATSPAVSRDDVAASLERHAGDLREVLFELYDLYEQQRA
jgi:hypothetical protein